MRQDDLLRFLEEDKSAPARADGACWRVLVVDDDEEVHAATRFAVGQAEILGRPLELLEARSAEEALRILRAHPDIAVAMLDVVMERADAGLWLVGRIREELGLSALRIILRTGQPGYAPEFDVIRRYDINDYRTKAELTRVRLLTLRTAAVRSYLQLCDAERGRRALGAIVRASTGVAAARALETFSLAALAGLESILEQPANGVLVARREQRFDSAGAGELYVCGGTGRFASLAGATLGGLPDPVLAARLDRCWENAADIVGSETCVLSLEAQGQQRALVWAQLVRPVDQVVRGLLPVYGANLAAAFANVQLFDRLEGYAYFDPLTGLPNRTLFIRLVQRRIDDERDGWAVAIADIDHFSGFNDALGHELGDRLIEQVAARLRRALPPEAVIARVAGDAFGILAPEAVLDPARMLALFEQPLDFDGSALRLSLSLGVVGLSESSGTGLGAIKEASIALNRGKIERRGHWQRYTREMEAQTRERLGLAQALRAALEREALEVHLQPQIELGNGSVVGAEALVRWRGADGKFVPPDRFIPVAEHAGLIVALGEFVLRTACRQLAAWQARGLAGLRMAINVSLGQFRSPDFMRRVAETIDEFGLDARSVELEITESMAMEDIDTVVDTLHALKRIGVQVAVDDFGTGYSSLGHLHRLALDRVKIDRIFVEQLSQAGKRASIAEMIVRLGHNLGLRVIAEGVETAAQAEALARLGCDEAQGYYFARPMDLASFEAWLAARGLLR
jgi:diguanylate cyclase (GGDEF)-like protein